MKNFISYFILLLVLFLTFLHFTFSQEANNFSNVWQAGIIAFYSERDGNPEIYIMNADGTVQTRLTQNNYEDIAPDISPDGSNIVFSSNRDGNFEIYKITISDLSTVRLTYNSADDAYPYWSSDGTKIIFSSKRDGNNFEIYIMDSNGEYQTRITHTAVNEEWAHLSNDTTKIIYSIGDFPNYDIWIMDSNGNNQHELLALPNIQAFPKWSRDDQKIAFNNAIFQNGIFSGNIYIMNNDGTDTLKLTQSPLGVVSEGPYWSPVGDKIVFQSNRSGNFQIYTMDANGGNESRLTNQPGNDYYPSWGPGSVTSVHHDHNYQESRLNLFQLFQNYPNPFNPVTIIAFQIPHRSYVLLNVYDVLGNEVATLVNEKKPAGSYEVEFSAKGLSSGIYLYQLSTITDLSERTENFMDTKKFILIK